MRDGTLGTFFKVSRSKQLPSRSGVETPLIALAKEDRAPAFLSRVRTAKNGLILQPRSIKREGRAQATFGNLVPRSWDDFDRHDGVFIQHVARTIARP